MSVNVKLCRSSINWRLVQDVALLSLHCQLGWAFVVIYKRNREERSHLPADIFPRPQTAAFISLWRVRHLREWLEKEAPAGESAAVGAKERNGPRLMETGRICRCDYVLVHLAPAVSDKEAGRGEPSEDGTRRRSQTTMSPGGEFLSHRIIFHSAAVGSGGQWARNDDGPWEEEVVGG